MFDSADVPTEPLVIWSVDDILTDLEAREEDDEWQHGDANGASQILLMSLDQYSKHGYGGGEDVGIVVPSPTVDGTWSNPRMPFVSYLRMAVLRWGGFPGASTATRSDVLAEIDSLRAGLVPF